MQVGRLTGEQHIRSENGETTNKLDIYLNDGTSGQDNVRLCRAAAFRTRGSLVDGDGRVERGGIRLLVHTASLVLLGMGGIMIVLGVTMTGNGGLGWSTRLVCRAGVVNFLLLGDWALLIKDGIRRMLRRSLSSFLVT